MRADITVLLIAVALMVGLYLIHRAKEREAQGDRRLAEIEERYRAGTATDADREWAHRNLVRLRRWPWWLPWWWLG